MYEEVALVDEEVALADSEVALVDQEATLVDEEVALVDEEVALVDVFGDCGWGWCRAQPSMVEVRRARQSVLGARITDTRVCLRRFRGDPANVWC